ncbi:hypothetical protein MIND_00561100 [Mycena indigotica]|uniref:Uncharacterized protein n=1 Tax=Mycena indigotica TaxID=2126181 RepID=A0A8H6SYJ3_9AGAR|nr:uncharacterized protein MIND_00561100 [Mycena indigotica]KAF7307658.1 hypothetical protein MIND_00561100 [Mycena indigotica]
MLTTLPKPCLEISLHILPTSDLHFPTTTAFSPRFPGHVTSVTVTLSSLIWRTRNSSHAQAGASSTGPPSARTSNASPQILLPVVSPGKAVVGHDLANDAFVPTLGFCAAVINIRGGGALSRASAQPNHHTPAIHRSRNGGRIVRGSYLGPNLPYRGHLPFVKRVYRFFAVSKVLLAVDWWVGPLRQLMDLTLYYLVCSCIVRALISKSIEDCWNSNYTSTWASLSSYVLL